MKQIYTSAKDVYLIYYDIEVPKCVCDKELSFISFKAGFVKLCNSCSRKDPERKAKVLESLKKTNLERYGVEHYFNKKQGQKTRIERYGEPFYNNREKAVKTCKDNDLYAKGRQKFKDSLTEEEYKEHYKKVFEKVYETKLAKYGDRNYNNSLSGQEGKRKTMESQGLWIPLDQISDWELYKRTVRKQTEINYSLYKDKINPSNYNRVLCGKDGHQLDHIISVQEGFLNNVPSYIIASEDNLQMLTWSENRAKWA